MNEVKFKKELEKKLRGRGMNITIDGDVLVPPQRMFKNLGEEVLWILNESKTRLSSKDLAKYLSSDTKTIQKVLRKLTNSNVNLVQKEKIGSRCFYTADFQDSINIPTAYKLIRKAATQYIR